MAVDRDSYATVAAVETLVGDIPINLQAPRTFGTDTRPTLQQVEGFINSVASEINIALINAGYVTPVMDVDDPHPFRYLAHANVCGAALLVLDTLPMDAYQAPMQPGPTGRRGHCQNIYLAALRLIEQEKLSTTRLGGETRLGDFRVGSKTDSDGRTNLPIFKRGGTDYPGSRSLTEA